MVCSVITASPFLLTQPEHRIIKGHSWFFFKSENLSLTETLWI